MAYQIDYHRWFKKSFARLSYDQKQKIYRFLLGVAQDPHGDFLGVKPLRGYRFTYRYRLGKFRLVYVIDDAQKRVVVLGVEPRGKVYQTIEKILG